MYFFQEHSNFVYTDKSCARVRAGRKRSGGDCINGTISRHLIGFVKICVREIRNGQWQIDYFMSAAAAEKRVR